MNQLADITIDNSESQNTLKRYLPMTTRTLANSINSKMFYIARGASRKSPMANKPEIGRELGVIGYKVKTRKRDGRVVLNKRTGAPVWQRVMNSKATLAALIVNKRKGSAGKPGLYGSKMKAAINAMIGKRFRSVGTVKAGWLNAIRAFGSAVGEGSYREVNPYRLKGRSDFKIAKEGWSPEASVAYNVNSFGNSHSQYIDRRTQAALAAAYNEEMRSMEKYIIDKMQKDVDRLSK